MFRESVSAPELGVIWAVRAAAFWGAILLPFIYLPMLIGGVNSVDEQMLFASLLLLNVVLLVVGHSHRKD